MMYLDLVANEGKTKKDAKVIAKSFSINNR